MSTVSAWAELPAAGAAPGVPPPVRGRPTAGPGWIAHAALAAVYLLLALVSIALSRQPGDIASTWYANAMAVVVLWRYRPASWPGLLGMVALANAAANALAGDGPLLALAFVPCNLLEVALGAWLLRRWAPDPQQVLTPGTLLRLLLLGGVLPQLVAATTAAAMLAGLGLGGRLALWMSWLESSVVGAAAGLLMWWLLLNQPLARSLHTLRDPLLWVLAPLTVATALLCLVNLPFPFVYLGLPLLVAGLLLDLLGVAMLCFAVAFTVALALSTGAFVPPPVTADWQQSLVFLACTAAVVPAQLLGAAVAELRAGNLRLQAREAELKRANEGLQQFVRIASHDLREPLNTIAQFSGLVAADHAHRLPPEAAGWLALVQGEAQRMRVLLDDVLQYAQLRQADLQTPPEQPVALDQVVADARQALAARLLATGAQLTVTPLPPVRGHASLLTLLVQNLLGNALKFQPPGQVPQVHISALQQPGWVTLQVADNGIGIGPADQAKLFRPFTRLHRRREFDGTGLGLALCRQVAEAHGGAVGVQSTPGRGALFWVRLPAA